MARVSKNFSHPARATVLAVAVHLLFALIFGLSLRFEPEIVQASQAEPIQAVFIDQAAIEREKERKAEQQKQREEEVRRQAEKKKAEQLEAKRQADLKKRQEVERERKIEEKKQRLAEEKRKVEVQRKIDEKRKADEKKQRQAEAARKAEEKKQRLAEEKRKVEVQRKIDEKRKADEKKQRQAEAARKAEEKKQRDAEAKRQAEEKRKKEAEAKRQAEEKKKREAEEAKRQLINSCSLALRALKGEIKNKVEDSWTYAGEATGLEVIISVKVTHDGEVASANEWRSSGDAIFDRSAVNALRKASPLPFPDDPRCYEHIKEFNFVFNPDD